MLNLVTGAGGFVGTELVKNLLRQGKRVRAMVRQRDAMAALAQLGAEPVLGDLTDRESLTAAVQGASKVFHIAALFRQAGLPASEFHHVNVEGTRLLLEAAQAAGVESFVHCSTVGVHGHVQSPPATEESPYNPGDPYQESKVEGEKVALDFFRSGKLKGNIIRPAMIYGPGDSRTLKLFQRIANRRFFYVGSGDSSVHFVDVRDLAAAFCLAGERRDQNGEVFIIAGETSLPLKKLVEIISSLMGVPEPWLHVPVRPMQLLGSLCEAVCTPLHLNPPIFRRRVDFFTKDRSFNCSKARQVLGYAPAQDLVAELIDIIASYVSAGLIDRAKLKKPSAILRGLDGEIHSWDEDAREVYGWSRDQAVGNVSHALLSTKFPKDLKSINAQLQSRGLWQGLLVHKNKQGQELTVESKWKLLHLPTRKDPLVLELNRRATGTDDTFISLSMLGQSVFGSAATFA